ncbi:chemotaxis protein [Hylemonella gracilis str. Niagara R]|uniref:Chemotaxis protein n=1 Tax=Hylemonella gracilis str. Niagara R TaxID=1458275 RepID=A0A016XI20_9BURK|nr:methyl-accepting chemotaxis protein [Hylemonella gracilis]EYC51481.1 chemotaxis protein [Hylemonella gracilis str. Niagara R]
MQIRVRLPLTIAALIVSLLGASFLGIYQLNQALRVFDVQVAATHQHERLVTSMLVSFKTQVQEWKNVLLRGGDPALLDRHWASFEKTEQEVGAAGRVLTDTLSTGEARRLVEQFLLEHRKMGEGYRRGLEAYKTSGYLAPVGDKSVSGMDRAPARLLDDAALQISKDAQALALAAHEQGQQAVLLSLALVLLVCLASVVLSIWLTRSLIRPIREAVAHTEEIARGNLGREIHAAGRDELAHLLLSLNTMRLALIDVVTRVRQSSDTVSMASTEIAQGNQDLSARTERQASALQQTAASMEELSSTVRQNAENAQQANQLARKASSVAEQGGEVVEQVVHTMKGINDSSHQISDIIGVIDGIAFQTNILALNAAVEAARAGEQGRGFAVVAGEVRGLAQRSADAAKQIKALIGESVQRVQQGSMQADQAGGTMGEVVSSIRRVTDIMGEISAASSEQSSGVSQIGEAVTQMDQATQQNAALVEQMAAAASSLRMQAQELVQVVAVFRLSSAGGGSSEQAPPLALMAA